MLSAGEDCVERSRIGLTSALTLTLSPRERGKLVNTHCLIESQS